MPWDVKEEHGDHFVINGNSGPFRISKANLGEDKIAKVRSYMKGGKVKGYAKGGKTPADDEPIASYQSTEVQNPAVPMMERAPDPGPARNPVAGPSLTAADNSEAGGETPSPDEIQRARFQAEDLRQRNINRGEDNEVGSLAPHGILESLQDPAYVAQKRGQPAPDRAAAQPSNTPDDASPFLRPGDPGTQEQPHTSQSQASRGGMDLSLPPLPPMTDLRNVERLSQDAQKRGGAAADLQQQAESQKAAALTSLYAQHTSDLQKLEAQRVEDTKSAAVRIDKMIADFQDPKSNIRPEHFWETRSTFQKVAAGLGMLLSGLGSGLSGQPNMAAAFIQKSIDRDIEAQKANLGKKENALGWAFKQYGNINLAAESTRSHLLATLAAQVATEGARTGDVQARAAAEILKSQLAQQALQPALQIASIQHQDRMMRYQMDWQRRLFTQFGGGAQESGYVPSGTPAPMLSEPSMKGISELEKAKGEARVSIPLPNGKQAFTYSDPRRAREQETALAHINTMEKALNEMERLGRDHKFNINTPWPNSDKVAFKNASSALDLGMGGLSQLQRFTTPEDMHYREMVGSPHLFLFGKSGQANINAMRKTMIRDKRQKVYDELGLKLGGRPQETPFGAQ